MKKLIVRLTAIAICLGLTGCGSSEANENEGTAKSENEIEQTPSESRSTSSSSSEKRNITKEDILQKAIGKSFVDEEQGYTVTVQEMVTNIPGKLEGDNYEGELFGVALKVLVASTEKKLSSGFKHTFQLQIGNEVINSQSFFSYFSDYAEEQNWKLIEHVRSGETKEGWIIFAVDRTNIDVPLTLKCQRPEIPVTVIGGENYTIPPKDFTVEL